jgi:small-conductance mechanosensitive channel/CRP-like cAMP-binding protein
VPDIPEAYKLLTFFLAVPGMYSLMVLIGRYFKRRHGVRLGGIYHLFSLSLAVYVPANLLNLSWTFLHHLGAIVVVLGALVVISIAERFVVDLHIRKHHAVTVPKFLTEVVAAVVLIVTVFLVLQFGYGLTIKELLIAPGIAAIVIGLAMQDLAGNVIAGIALQSGRSFAQGDWLLVDNRYAEVVEITWRSTRLRTLDDVSLEIPNRDLARLIIVNLNRPQTSHAVRLNFIIDYSEPPTRVKGILLHAASNARGVLPEPKPRAFVKNFSDYGVEYEIKFSLISHRDFSEVCDAVRTNVWYALRRHGIKIPFPTRTVQLERPVRDKQQEVQSAARTILREQPIFKCLGDEQLDALLPRGRTAHFGKDEKLIQQGEAGQSMFLLVSGEANVTVERNGNPTLVASLGAGDCFGEMSLLTGEPRTATVIANSDCEVVEIDKAVLARSVKENPQLLKQLSELLARRQMETEGLLASGTPSTIGERQSQYAAGFLGKLRHFFEL